MQTTEWATGYVYPAASLTKHGFYTAARPFTTLVLGHEGQSDGAANHNVTWLTNKTFNAGVDFGTLERSSWRSFDYFRRHRTGLMAVIPRLFLRL